MKYARFFSYLVGGVFVCSCQIYTDDLLRTSNLTANVGGAGTSSAGLAAAAGMTALGGAAAGGTAAGASGDASTGRSSPACLADTDCDDRNPCTVDHCDSSGACSPTAGNPGAVCRPTVGACDIAASCTGSSATCPANTALGNGTACDDADASTCNDVCSAGACSGSTSCSPCSGLCSKPVNIDDQGNPNTASPFCYERTKAMGANAGGVVGKGFEVNGHAVTTDGAVPWPAKRYGGYCFKSDAPLDWLSLY